jgi:hypothetical protein
MSNFMKVRLMGADLFHADRQTDGHTDGLTDRMTDGRTDGRTDRHDQASSRFPQF